MTTTVDGVVAHEGFLVGGEAGFDVQKAQLTRYSAAFGYHAPTYSMAVTATNNLKLFSASYYHKVNTEVEAGAKATWDSTSGSNVGLEVATKYKLDRLVYFERFEDVHKAIEREKQIKGWLRIKKIALIVAVNPAWRDLSLEWYERHPFQPDEGAIQRRLSS